MKKVLYRAVEKVCKKYNLNKKVIKRAVSMLCAVSLASNTVVPVFQMEAIANTWVETSSNATPETKHHGHGKKYNSGTASNAEALATAPNALYKGILVCGNDEHEHDESCYCEDEAAAEVILMIHELPEVEDVEKMLEDYYEIEETVEEYEEDEEWKEYDKYFASLYEQVQDTYEKYNELDDEQKDLVFNAEKLLGLAELFGNEAVLLAINSEAPEVQDAASTAEFITLNLYDYGSNINEKYDSDSKMPGFQWNGGAQEGWNDQKKQFEYNLTLVDCIDFGNSLITDLAWDNKKTIANKDESNINGLVENPTKDYANYPVGISTKGEVLSRTLKDGYPALADGTSLSYLFSDGKYAKKQNTKNIDGLFQHNEETGAYWYKSRENHAQYSDNEFTLYKDKITPNFILYPFGNFLPFNDITDIDNTVTQVSKIENGNSYIHQMINTAAQKRDVNENGKSSTYQKMINGLVYYRDNYFNNNTKSAADMVSDFFSNGGPAKKQFSLNDFKDLYNIDYNTEKNFFFGMDMSMRFMQPKNGLTGNSGKEPMVFEFNGDDDVWVYVDGVLFLDLSGIHRHVGGKIDFVNGKVHYYNLDPSKGDVSDTPYKTDTFEEILENAGKDTSVLNSKGTFEDYTYHDFKFYYMERGSGSSVCNLSFNFPLLKQNVITVEKELTVDEEGKALLGNKEFSFQILKADDSGNKKSDLFIEAGTSYDLYDNEGKLLNEDLKVDENGIFKLKPGERAEFSIPENVGNYYVRELLDPAAFEQYGKISVNGTTTTTVNNVSVESKTFVGADSPVQNASDGAVQFKFNNKIASDKLGSLEISKKLELYPDSDTSQTSAFKFLVELNGEGLPKGTRYTVDSVDKKVEEEGIIVIPAGSTAVISDILVGTEFMISETDDSAKDYNVSYTATANNALEISETSVIGRIAETKQIIKITATNTEIGATIKIPVKKLLVNGNGRVHSYTFNLEQVEDYKASASNGVMDSKKLTVNGTGECTAKDYFEIHYRSKDFTEKTKLYYMITEQADQSQSDYVKYDSSKYVAEVTVTKSENTMKAEITKWYVNGSETNADAATFTNMLLGDISIKKTVKDVTPDETKEFSFTMRLATPYNAVNGTYGDLTFEDGTAVFTLKHNEIKSATGLPLGAEYTITEAVPVGYWAEIGEVKTNEAHGVITKDESVYVVHVINHKKPDSPDKDNGGGKTPKTPKTPRTPNIEIIEENNTPLGTLDIIEDDPVPLGALPQTGTTWWFAMILACASVILFTAGFVRNRGCDEDEK